MKMFAVSLSYKDDNIYTAEFISGPYYRVNKSVESGGNYKLFDSRSDAVNYLIKRLGGELQSNRETIAEYQKRIKDHKLKHENLRNRYKLLLEERYASADEEDRTSY